MINFYAWVIIYSYCTKNKRILKNMKNLFDALWQGVLLREEDGVGPGDQAYLRKLTIYSGRIANGIPVQKGGFGLAQETIDAIRQAETAAEAAEKEAVKGRRQLWQRQRLRRRR